MKLSCHRRTVATLAADWLHLIRLPFARPYRNSCAGGSCATAVAGFIAWERKRGCKMGWISWIILGLIAGFIASKIVNHTGSGMLTDIVIGIVGAIVGGYIGSLLGLGGVNGINIGSIILAIIGSVIVLFAYNAISSRA
jgi:uncharacterized membrane protein YeaQ/YmgE (transglycosylase-associated protein family)